MKLSDIKPEVGDIFIRYKKPSLVTFEDDKILIFKTKINDYYEFENILNKTLSSFGESSVCDMYFLDEFKRI